MSPQQVFDSLEERIAGNPGLVETVDAVFQFDISGADGGSWTVDLKNPPGSVETGKAADADCVIAVGAADFTRIMTGAADPVMAFMMGKVRVSGDIATATRLKALVG